LKSTKLPLVINKEVVVGTVKYEPDKLVTQYPAVLKGVVYLIESNSKKFTDVGLWSFKQAVKMNSVTCQELIDGYWGSYSDQYVGKEGIQWRHLWKHIDEQRTCGQKPMTYSQMLNDMHRKGLTTESYLQVNEEDTRGNKKWVLK